MSSLLDDQPPAEVKPFPCPDCEKSYSQQAGLDRHRENAHGLRRARSVRTARGGNLQADLAKAHLGVSMLVVGATNPGVLGAREVVDVLERQSSNWAATLVGVAQQDERVMSVVLAAMHTGVWIAFASATATSFVTLGALTGRLQVPYGAVAYLAPELARLFPPEVPVPPAPPGPPPPPNGNGAQ